MTCPLVTFPTSFVADDLEALEGRAGLMRADATLAHGDLDLLGDRIHAIEHGEQQAATATVAYDDTIALWVELVGR